MYERIIAYCDCGETIAIAHDNDELEYIIASKGTCKCGCNPHITKKGEQWDFYTREVRSPYIEKYSSDISESLKVFNEKFSAEKTAFIMMEIPDRDFTPEQKETNKQILEIIQGVLSDHGYIGIRADFKDYHSELLPNVMTYMEGCGFGIVVFLEDYNPNVSLESGYMISNGKPICFLKEKNLEKLYVDIISKLYKEFDASDLETIKPELEKWLKDTLI